MTGPGRGVYLEWGDMRKFSLQMAVESGAAPSDVVQTAHEFLDFLCGRTVNVNSDSPQ